MKSKILLVSFLIFLTLLPFMSSLFACHGIVVQNELCTDENTRKQIAQRIIDNLAKENFEAVRDDFSGALKSQLSAQNIKDVWFNVTTQLGKYEKVVSTRVGVSQGYNQVFTRCKFAVDNVTVEVGFNEEDKVIALFIKS